MFVCLFVSFVYVCDSEYATTYAFSFDVCITAWSRQQHNQQAIHISL